MQPFNLADALAGKPVVTRDGRDVVNIEVATDPSDTQDPNRVRGTINDNIYVWFTDGTWDKDSTPANEDLFMASISYTGWINIYGYGSSYIFPTEDEANQYASPDRLGCVPVTWVA